MDRREFVAGAASVLVAACSLPALAFKDKGKIEPSRKVEIRRGGNKWESRSFGEIRRGDVFKLFEPDGEPLQDGECGAWVATCDAHKHYPDGHGGKWTWAVESDQWRGDV